MDECGKSTTTANSRDATVQICFIGWVLHVYHTANFIDYCWREKKKKIEEWQATTTENDREKTYIIKEMDLNQSTTKMEFSSSR